MAIALPANTLATGARLVTLMIAIRFTEIPFDRESAEWVFKKFSQHRDRLGKILTAPRYLLHAERLIGSIRRECLDHIIVLNELSLRRILKSYFDYYQHSRTHLSLAKDAPEP